jgi:hypothetical protein
MALGVSGGIAAAQTYGFATMQPGALNHTTAPAIAFDGAIYVNIAGIAAGGILLLYARGALA